MTMQKIRSSLLMEGWLIGCGQQFTGGAIWGQSVFLLELKRLDVILFRIIILTLMENQFPNYSRDHAYYPYFPFVQYYSPKMYNVLNIGHHLDESTHHVPHTPQAPANNASPGTPNRQPLNESQSNQEDEEKSSSKALKPAKTNRRKSVDEYKPYQRQSKKKSNFLKENRNVLPIKIRQMLSFLTRQRKSHEIIERFVEQSGLTAKFNQKRFYAFLKMKKQKVGNYVTLSILKNFLGVQPEKADLYSVNEQTLFLRIVRVLFRYYLHHISCLCSLTSNRIQSQQKIEHVRVQRQLMEFLSKEADY